MRKATDLNRTQTFINQKYRSTSHNFTQSFSNKNGKNRELKQWVNIGEKPQFLTPMRSRVNVQNEISSYLKNNDVMREKRIYP